MLFLCKRRDLQDDFRHLDLLWPSHQLTKGMKPPHHVDQMIRSQTIRCFGIIVYVNTGLYHIT